MARSSNYPLSSLGEVRRYFGLTQAALGQYLGLSRTTLANLEAGRRQPSATTLRRLLPLEEQLPPGWLSATESPAAPPTAAPAAEPLRARIAECQYLAGQLRAELRGLDALLAVARRWQQALPALLAAEPFRATPTELARLPLVRRWLQRRGEDAATQLTGSTVAEYHLRLARAEALEAEAAALRRLLSQTPPAA